jgi:DNA-damage-inducible protein J
MAELSTVTAKIDHALKAEVENIFQGMNLSINQAINLFFIYVQQSKALPFESEMPNEETSKAINAAREGIDLIACENADDMFKKLGI